MTRGGVNVLRNEKGFIEPRNYPPSSLEAISDKGVPKK
ncbi:hypothetical protein A0J61_06943, partial [Choanephora cucurbitarum]